MNIEIKLSSDTTPFELLCQCPDPKMKPVVAMVERAPRARAVLVLGETGSGKEIVARAIHQKSGRAGEFVDVNCGNMNTGIMGSELFGHERGSFTGAAIQHIGLCEKADGGTLFLDEIGELPIELQARLLRALQFKDFTRVGGTQRVRTNFLLISATNRDPAMMIKEGKLREDLYHRLCNFPIVVPPLRERPKDIAPLAKHFARSFEGGFELHEESLALLKDHSWPGNARELQNVLERAILMMDDGEQIILPKHLEELRKKTPLSSGSSELSLAEQIEMLLPSHTLPQVIEKIERALIVRALREHQTVLGAAEMLGVDRGTVKYKIAKWGIVAERVVK